MSLVAAVKHVEMIRDGGSFSASFMDASQVEYTLWFPIRRHGTEIEHWGHGDPFVARVVHYSDDKTVGWRMEDIRLVTWDEALSLLEEIRPLISDTDVWSLRWFKEMIGVAQRSGKPPPGSSSGVPGALQAVAADGDTVSVHRAASRR